MKKWAAIVPLTIIAASTGLFKLFGSLPSLLSKIPGIGKFFGSGATLASSGTGAASGGSMNAAQMLASGKGSMYKGFGSAAQLAAIGVAAVGIGYGFKMAAEGAASLSVSISKLCLSINSLIILSNSIYKSKSSSL
jgi:hypothetical protein